MYERIKGKAEGFVNVAVLRNEGAKKNLVVYKLQ